VPVGGADVGSTGRNTGKVVTRKPSVGLREGTTGRSIGGLEATNVGLLVSAPNGIIVDGISPTSMDVGKFVCARDGSGLRFVDSAGLPDVGIREETSLSFGFLDGTRVGVGGESLSFGPRDGAGVLDTIGAVVVTFAPPLPSIQADVGKSVCVGAGSSVLVVSSRATGKSVVASTSTVVGSRVGSAGIAIGKSVTESRVGDPVGFAVLTFCGLLLGLAVVGDALAGGVVVVRKVGKAVGTGAGCSVDAALALVTLTLPVAFTVGNGVSLESRDGAADEPDSLSDSRATVGIPCTVGSELAISPRVGDDWTSLEVGELVGAKVDPDDT
jgi:hypothetical protein